MELSMNKLLRVLIVEDSEDDAELLVIELTKGGYQVIYRRVDTDRGMAEALENNQNWDLVIADYSMPVFSAISALEMLKEYQLDLPFIIVSGRIGEDTAVAAMKAGAHDYLIKGKLARLLPAVERELREALLRQEYREAQQRLRYLAYYDVLTGLPNRTSFIEHLSREIAQNREFNRDENKLFAVLMLSIDRFRTIEHSLGHLLGEQLLIAAARRLEAWSRQQENVTIARIERDEFAILLADLMAKEMILDQTEAIYRELIVPFLLQGTEIFSTVSIGIALSTLDYQQPEQLLQAADTAMQYAKVNFINSSVLFDEQMHATALEKLRLESDLQTAIENRHLYLNYQPIVSLKNGNIAGLEALVRWDHADRGKIPPDKFIPLSEETGQIIPLGQWILSEACRQLVNWQKYLSRKFSFGMSINLSRLQISHPKLLPHIDNLLESLELAGENLKLEITESTLMENTKAVTKVLEQLKARKIKLCIDDFGTGYSSLSYLRYLPVDTVKIDRSFISDEITDKNYDIVKAIINLAHSLELDVVAEGIETKAQLKMLRSLGCEYGQGYLFAYPLNSQGILDLLEQKVIPKQANNN
jgi:diguanylate cyclase (GGDEF)-like protein